MNMRLHTVILMLHLLSGGFPGVVFGEIHKVNEGEDITVDCWLYWSGSKRIFCKNPCDKRGDILVETTENKATKGRYTIVYVKNTIRYNQFSVSIRKAQLSDSGQYWCKLENSNSWESFEIKVIKAPSVRPSAPVNPPASEPPATALTATQRPSPGLSPSPDPHSTLYPGSVSVETSGTSVPPPADSHTSTTAGSVLFVGLALAVIMLFLTVTLLILYKKKKKDKSRNIFSEALTEEVDREYEEIPEQQDQSRVSSDIYSLASAPAQPQVDTAVQYSEVKFIKSAPHSQTEAVLYSTVQKEDDLYCNVTSRQDP